MKDAVQIATARYQMRKLDSWSHYCIFMINIVRSAKNSNADILLSPECVGMNISSIFDKPISE